MSGLRGVSACIEQSRRAAQQSERQRAVEPDTDVLIGEEVVEGDTADHGVVGDRQAVHGERDGAGGVGGGEMQSSGHDGIRQVRGAHDGCDDVVGLTVAGRDLQEIDDAPAADERCVSVESPAAVGTGRRHPRWRRDHAGVGDSGAQPAGGHVVEEF